MKSVSTPLIHCRGQAEFCNSASKNIHIFQYSKVLSCDFEGRKHLGDGDKRYVGDLRQLGEDRRRCSEKGAVLATLS